jgi:hypothetical protein
LTYHEVARGIDCFIADQEMNKVGTLDEVFERMFK